jgi:hypothetical protein
MCGPISEASVSDLGSAWMELVTVSDSCGFCVRGPDPFTEFTGPRGFRFEGTIADTRGGETISVFFKGSLQIYP